ncbi:LOW QUALITY PROTEIN: hypothetical protein LZ30DRAFT_751840 [Colletotrichum cereale]|nr:LOW QUALITY PROTEIN: hypothetical protein LZ30DRAFT_751840 [Colletotrichum cereale]
MKDRNWSPVGTRRRGLRSFAARLTLRLLAVASIVVVYHVLELHFRYREAMRAKYLPTVFGNLSEHDEAILASTGWEEPNMDATNAERSALLDNRRHWKRLGMGREGDTFTFNNTVIKVYNEESTPFRNCMQNTRGPPRRWPTEIPASLVMGGLEGGSPPPDNDPNKELFVPVKDYFLAATDPLLPPKWHLVTPFLQSGTLKNLARRLRASGGDGGGGGGPSHRELDRAFRPSFESLLAALEDLHAAHGLCHDDVKLDNVFVGSERDPGRWKLGDLGNAREPGHPYHATALWTADTPQLRDCRANDALRLTRFLRRAGGDPAAFDEALFRGVEAFSRLYWAVVARAAHAPAGPATAAQLSRAYPPDGDGDGSPWMTTQPADVGGSRGWAPAAEAVLGWKWSLASAVKRELRVGAKEGPGKFWGLTWLFGIPVGACQAG